MTAAPSDLRAALAHARHELRTPVNAILGYSEMLIEEVVDGGRGDCLPILQETHALGQQLNVAITRLLGEPEVERLKPDDLPALEATVRATLQTPSQGVLDRCALLLEQTDRPELQALQPDLQRIRTAAANLLALLEQPLSASALPKTEDRGSRIEDRRSKIEDQGGPCDPQSSILDPRSSTTGGHVGHVLIVDDNALNRDMLARLLAKQHHTHEMAGHGRQALELLAGKCFDLVLLDVLMPEMDGFETLRRIKENPALKHIPVIMISALDEISSVVRCVEMGAEDYLPKPFDPVLLRARVGACLEKKRLRDQELDYLRQVAVVTEAAAAIESSTFQPDRLEEVARRSDPLGRLACVFLGMAREVQAREQRLKQQLQQLRVEIDETRKAKQVAEITESDYFQTLQQKAQALRRRPPAGK